MFFDESTIETHLERFPHYLNLNWFSYSLTRYLWLVNLKQETFPDGFLWYIVLINFEDVWFLIFNTGSFEIEEFFSGL